MTTSNGGWGAQSLGFFERPWAKLTLEEASAGIALSGARWIGMLWLPTSGEPGAGGKRPQMIGRGGERAADGPLLSAEEAAAVRATLAAHGLSLAAHRPRVSFSLPDAEFVAGLEREFDLAEQLGLAAWRGTRYLLFGGPNAPAEHERFWLLMRLGADAAAQRGFTFVLKPHGGLLGTARDCLDVVRRLDHPAVQVAYDPGNVIFYTGADPLDGLRELAPHVKALCVKDCSGRGVPRPEYSGGVALQPGQGLVDFAALFAILRDSGFAGPALVETLGAGELDDVNRQARETMMFLRDLVGTAGA